MPHNAPLPKVGLAILTGETEYRAGVERSLRREMMTVHFRVRVIYNTSPDATIMLFKSWYEDDDASRAISELCRLCGRHEMHLDDPDLSRDNLLEMVHVMWTPINSMELAHALHTLGLTTTTSAM